MLVYPVHAAAFCFITPILLVLIGYFYLIHSLKWMATVSFDISYMSFAGHREASRGKGITAYGSGR